jgi:hypothetical protein
MVKKPSHYHEAKFGLKVGNEYFDRIGNKIHNLLFDIETINRDK